jgi:hypothetical protein
MRNKKLLSTLFIASIALVTLFAATKAVAQCPTCVPISNSCTLVDSNGNLTGYKISIAPNANGKWPWPPAPGSNLYTWAYSLNPGPTQQSQLLVLAPACCPQTTYTVPSGGQVLCPGEGDPTSNWGFAIGSEYVIRMAYASPAAYGFYTDRPVAIRNTSMQLKSGNKYYYAPNIAGPAPTGGVGALAQTECITLNTDTSSGEPLASMSLSREQSTGYADPYSVRFYNSTNCTGEAFLPDDVSIDPEVVYCTGGAGQKNECIQVTTGSPFCVTMTIQNRKCTYCY